MVLAGLALSSCAAPCTLIGCVDTVTLQLVSADSQQFAVGEPVDVTACLGNQCVTATVTAEGSGASSSTDGDLALNGNALMLRFDAPVTGEQTVTLELKKSGAVVFAQSRSGVVLTEASPNGPGCQPVCQFATVEF